MDLVHVVPTYESTHIVDIIESCWCSPQYKHLHGGLMVIHADAISRTLNCYPAFHGTLLFPVREIVNEGPIR